MKVNAVYENLLKYGIKPSVQRMAVMDYLIKHATHPSVDEIYSALEQKYPILSRTTVYNTLKLFVEHGAAQMLTIDEKVTCFDGNITPHAHFLCKQCGKIYDLSLTDSVENIDWMQSDGYVVTEINHYYKGICKKCNVENNRVTN